MTILVNIGRNRNKPTKYVIMQLWLSKENMINMYVIHMALSLVVG